MNTLRRERSEAAARTRGADLRRVARRFWPETALLLGVVLWWPAGFWGLGSWLRLPLRLLDGDVLVLGAAAAAATVALLVRAPWPRLGVVVAFSGLGWVLSAPSRDSVPGERADLAILVAVAALVGIALGARGPRSLLGTAGVLAIVAGLSPATWPHGLPLAVALALPFAVATWARVAPTLLSVARLLVTWLVFGLLAASLRHGWAALGPHRPSDSGRSQAGRVLQAFWHYLSTQWWAFSQSTLAQQVGWFWVAAVLAVLIVVARVLTNGSRRRSPAGSSSRPGS
ncbi:hypothetical protein [Pedococcus sp.]|uniref:hypothetical protein n=1 Tax=Pedococcus sp. TaxID=2860345 RepID=UPI002E0DAE6E|nr:hypothetical protein [Pedococcus sp.]